MKLVQSWILLQVVVSLLPEAVVSFRMRQRAPPVERHQQPTTLKKHHMDQQPVVVERVIEFVPVPVIEVVSVPVMEVVVVDDRSSGATRADPIGASCEQELMALEANATLLDQAEQCEKNAQFMEQAVKALKDADMPEALKSVETSFSKCTGISSSCAKKVAPSTVLKMRLSGMAISEQCGAVVKETPKDPTKACMENMTMGIVQGLQQEDIVVAMAAAQSGLDRCMHIKHPCNFQFAPVLVGQIIQISMQKEQQQPPISEVLLTGLHEAQQISSNLTSSAKDKGCPEEKKLEEKLVKEADRASKEVKGIMHDMKEKMNAVHARINITQQKLKEHNAATQRLSLLSVQNSLRITFKSHNFAL